MSTRKPYYGFLDLVRLYCALLIVVIHMGFGNSFSLVPCLTRQGVPFFFLASGFFLSKKLQNCAEIREAMLRTIRPLLLVYLFWNAVWLPSILVEYTDIYPDAPLKLIAVLIRRFFTAGIAPYWYLLVLAEGDVLLALMFRYRRYKIGSLLCVLGIALGILYSYQAKNDQTCLIYRVFYTVFSWDNNVIMSGFPLLFLGALFDLHEARLSKVSFWPVLILYIFSVAAAFFVYSMDEDLFFVPFGLIQANLLFLLCIVPSPFPQDLPESVCRNARDLSSVLFLTHTVFLTILGNVLHLWNASLRYGMTVLCAFLLFLLAKRLKNKALSTLLLMK